MNWYLHVLRKYAEFSGRARRKEYWMFVLFNTIFLIVAIILDNVLGTAIENVGFGFFYFLYILAVLIPGLAVLVRRLHDVGKSGWMILISLVPIIGVIWLFVLMVIDSNPGENKYGPNPKESHSVDSAKNDTQLSSTTKDKLTGDTIILIAVIWIVFYKLFWAVLPKLLYNMYSVKWVHELNGIMGLIWAFVPIGLAFAIKNKSKRMVLFIIGGLYLLYGFYEMITQFGQAHY